MAGPLALLVGRQRLAGDLRRIRNAAGISGPALARLIGISQSAISKIENGKLAPRPELVEAWARACGVDDAEIRNMREATERARSDLVATRNSLRNGLAPVQYEVTELHEAATGIAVFHPTQIPDLLRTAELTRHVLEQVQPPFADMAGALQLRVERQQILYDEGRHFVFVVPEIALRWRIAPPPVYLQQIDRMATLSTLHNVRVVILPMDREFAPWHSHGFRMFEFERPGDDRDPVVMVELLNSVVTISAPEDVEEYRSTFARMLEGGVEGDEAAEVLRRIRADMEN